MAFTTTGKFVPQNKPSGISFTPIMRFGGVDVSSGGGAYLSQTGVLFYPIPGILQFRGRVIISGKGSATGSVDFRLPATDADGNSIPVPAVTGTHAMTLINTSVTPVDHFSCLQNGGSLSTLIYKHVGATRSDLTDADVSATFGIYVSGWYSYTL